MVLHPVTRSDDNYFSRQSAEMQLPFELGMLKDWFKCHIKKKNPLKALHMSKFSFQNKIIVLV